IPVADWNERSRISFQASAPSTSGMIKPTRICSQPIAPVLIGVITGALAGFTFVPGAGVAGAVTEVPPGGWLTGTVVGPAVIVKSTWARIATRTSVVANCNGFSERAGVTRYQ